MEWNKQVHCPCTLHTGRTPGHLVRILSIFSSLFKEMHYLGQNHFLDPLECGHIHFTIFQIRTVWKNTRSWETFARERKSGGSGGRLKGDELQVERERERGGEGEDFSCHIYEFLLPLL